MNWVKRFLTFNVRLGDAGPLKLSPWDGPTEEQVQKLTETLMKKAKPADNSRPREWTVGYVHGLRVVLGKLSPEYGLIPVIELAAYTQLCKERDELLEQAGDLNHVLSKHVKRAGELGRQVATLTEALRKEKLKRFDRPDCVGIDAEKIVDDEIRATLAKAGVK